ncbi:hypothetical protein Brsp04_04619 [Brucella sp. NBRC 12952]
MFIVANRARKAMNRMDDFHAALAAGDEDALDIRRLVSEAGLAIARSTSSTAWKQEMSLLRLRLPPRFADMVTQSFRLL